MLELMMSNTIDFDTRKLPKGLVEELKDIMSVDNPYYEKDDSAPEYIRMHKLINGIMKIPRGALSYIVPFLVEWEVEYEVIDNRLLLDELADLEFTFNLRKYQKKAGKKALAVTQATIEAPCGSGKTILGCWLITQIKQPTLVIVPDNEILKQWIERLHQSTGIDLDRVSILSSEKVIMQSSKGDVLITHGINDITIATNASAYLMIKDEKAKFKLQEHFGCVILDEAHQVGARTFRSTMNEFPAKYRYGLTATPFRSDGLTEFIECYCGQQCVTITDEMLLKEDLLIKPDVYRVDTKFKFTYDWKYNNAYAFMMKLLSNCKDRNSLIIDYILKEYHENRMVLVVAKTEVHTKILESLLRKNNRKIRVGNMAGAIYDEETAENARNGKIDVILSVDRAKQGLDIKPLETVMLVAPRKDKGQIQQIIGRCSRPDDCFGKYENPNEKEARVYDFVDPQVKVIKNGSQLLVSSYEARLEVYEQKCGKIKHIKVGGEKGEKRKKEDREVNYRKKPKRSNKQKSS